MAHVTEADEGKFTVLLNAQRELEEQLAEFKSACDAHDKHHRKRCKRRYYTLALMARVVCNTTPEELKRLLKNGTKTLLIDSVTNKLEEIVEMVQMIRNVIAEEQAKESANQLVVGIALEITGDSCRIGRIRNNCSIFLEKESVLTLTTDTSYKYSGFKEILYAINLHYYMQSLKLNVEIKIGDEVCGRIVKTLKNSFVIRIITPGIVNSYEYVEFLNQCDLLEPQTAAELFIEDLELADRLQVDFIVLPHISSRPFVKLLRNHLKERYDFKLIGTLHLDYIKENKLDIVSIVKLLDFLWLQNLFKMNQDMHTFVCQDVIPITKCLRKPIIGTVPLERCSDFRIFENHDFLWKIDCIFIEKSPWCNKYPLIVKKLLPIKDYRRGIVENTMALRSILTSYQSVVNFIIRTISSIECQAIFLHAKCETAAAALGRVEIYCPVYVVLPLGNNDVELQCRLQLAKILNLRRNLRLIIYSEEMNIRECKPIDYGIEYARSFGAIETGDFIITIEVGKEGGEDSIQFGVGEDVVIMRAFYVAPKKIGDKYKC